MSSTPTFTPQLIGQTEKTLNAILDRLLDSTGLSEPQWVTLSLAVAAGGTADGDQLVGRVTGALHVGEADARELVGGLAGAGLLDVPDEAGTPVRVTDAGQQLFDQVRAGVSEVTERLWGDLPAEDLAVAGRVLDTILARATAELA